MKYGKHTDLVEAFLAHLKSGNVDWKVARDVCDADLYDAWNAALSATSCVSDAWSAWSDAFGADRDARVAASAAPDAVCDAAGYATAEIIGHEVLAEQNKPLVFLPMFGIESIEQLKEMVK